MMGVFFEQCEVVYNVIYFEGDPWCVYYHINVGLTCWAHACCDAPMLLLCC